MTGLVCEELGIPEDKIHVTLLSKKTGEEADYIVTFISVPKPMIKDYPNLEIIGNWEDCGEKSYRLWAAVSQEEFKQFIIQEVAIPEDSFTIYSPADMTWTRML